MKDIIFTSKLWLAEKLMCIATALREKANYSGRPSKFVDLAPTNEADKTGVYSEAIAFALGNANVFNVALTGPYGSGKSSIIQTFLKNHPQKALHISLAAFIPEGKKKVGNVETQEIERSILQQMLYGADANKLPLSRFKRIQSPSIVATARSLYIMLGVIALWYVFPQKEHIFSGAFFTPLAMSNWLNLGSLALSIVFLWSVFHHFYIASFGLSLKSISLKDVELKPAQDDQSSVLNRHLDEIIYFFQSTDYDLVIIEDLDRFNNSEIFVILREINSLVNENAGVKRSIRFLYALRDDMFVNKDRTKFFEFIIPVIPIVNTSNSIDMVLEQGKRLDLDDRLDKQFLREVSRYLNDLRLIQNIFNEYAIYMANLDSDGDNVLNANKLLALLIYKNIYPRDFEQLHGGTGVLADILSDKGRLIESGEDGYRAQIVELEKKLKIAESQTPKDLKELRQIYAMALIEGLPEGTTRVSIDRNNWIFLSQLGEADTLNQLLGSTRLHYIANNTQSWMEVSKLQSQIASQEFYTQRQAEISNKVAENKRNILREIGDLRSKINNLRTIKLSELLRTDNESIQNLFDDFKENKELARFLILEGHIDDTYYQYTSLFHTGRLSPNDNKFLIQIRSYSTPEPSFPIDNPKEVIAAMRDEDFGQSYVLNVKLVDSLISTGSYPDQAKKFFKMLTTEFDSCEDFLVSYYSSGRDVSELFQGLASSWEGFVPAIISSSNNITHLSQLVSNLPQLLLEKLASDFEELSEFVSEHLPEILVNVPELAPERLKCLNVMVQDLSDIQEYSGIARFMVNEGLYDLTIANVEYVYQTISGETDTDLLREKNYTLIRSMNDISLMKRVERNFDDYLFNILLSLENNMKEDASTILAVICREDLDEDDLQMFLERQTTSLPTLENVPENLLSILFKIGLIQPDWNNCLAYINSDNFEAASLVEYLNKADVRATILEREISANSDLFKLRQFLFNALSLSDTAYRQYVQALPLSFNDFPSELDPAKVRILIDEEKVTFSKKSFDRLIDYGELQVHFVATNIASYLKEPDEFELDDDFLEELLRCKISSSSQIELIKSMDLDLVVDLPDRASIIGSILQNTDAELHGLNPNIVRYLIEHSKPVETQIILLNKYHDYLSIEEIRQLLADFPWPFSGIKTGYKTPKLKSTPENITLVKWLDSRDIISSWSPLSNTQIKVNLLRR